MPKNDFQNKCPLIIREKGCIQKAHMITQSNWICNYRQRSSKQGKHREEKREGTDCWLHRAGSRRQRIVRGGQRSNGGGASGRRWEPDKGLLRLLGGRDSGVQRRRPVGLDLALQVPGGSESASGTSFSPPPHTNTFLLLLLLLLSPATALPKGPKNQQPNGQWNEGETRARERETEPIPKKATPEQ